MSIKSNAHLLALRATQALLNLSGSRLARHRALAMRALALLPLNGFLWDALLGWPVLGGVIHRAQELSRAGDFALSAVVALSVIVFALALSMAGWALSMALLKLLGRCLTQSAWMRERQRQPERLRARVERARLAISAPSPGQSPQRPRSL